MRVFGESSSRRVGLSRPLLGSVGVKIGVKDLEDVCSAIYAPELNAGQFQPEGVVRELLVVGHLGDLGDAELPAL